MALTGKQVSARVGTLLNDIDTIRWTGPELLMWINDGRREMAAAKPRVFGALSKVQHTLTAGAYQTLNTTGAFEVTDVECNINADGSRGAAVRIVPRTSLDSFRPGWMSETGTKVQDVMLDGSNPIAFWVYPTVAGARIDVVARVSPPDLTSLDDVALPFDQYLAALTNYVLYRAYSKDSEVGGNAQVAAAYLTLFTNAMTAV